jgi:hypothetical protein
MTTDATDTERAVELLRECLGDGARPARELEVIAATRDIGHWPLYHAKQRLGVVVHRQGFGRGSSSIWSLADRKAKRAATYKQGMPHRLPTDDLDTTAIAALRRLGYTNKTATEAVRMVMAKGETETEPILRRALQQLSKR